MKQVIIVSKIKNTRNPEIKQLELRTEILKAPEANPVATFLRGLPNVAPGKEVRVAYQSVSTENIVSRKIQVGSNFHEAFPEFGNAKLVVVESFTPKTWTLVDGSTGIQEPKINPQTGQVLTRDDKPIYRSTQLSVDGKLEDVYIQHDNISVPGQQASTSNSMEELAAKGKKLQVEEPVLPEQK